MKNKTVSAAVRKQLKRERVITETVFKEFIYVLYGVLKELQQRRYKRTGQRIITNTFKTNAFAYRSGKTFSSAFHPFQNKHELKPIS
jgi:hypothetical protein